MPFQNLFERGLKELVEQGDVPLARIDDAALRLLRQQIRFGQGRLPGDYTAEVLNCAAHRQLAREAAQKGIVLLKNEGGLLPLRNMRRVAVIGKLAETPNTGDRGSSNTNPAYVVTPLQGLQAAAGPEVTVVYDDGSDPIRAAAVAQAADVAICVVGYTGSDEGEYIAPDTMSQLAPLFPPPTAEEVPIAQAMMQARPAAPADDGAFGAGGDRSLLTLHAQDEALLQAVTAANPRTVVAIMAGSAVITEAWRAQAPAILMLWYPGMEGGNALADILLGRTNPSGKLPLTFPKRAEDLPYFDRNATAITYDLFHGYRKLDRDGAEPAFPFGFGLSYTTFALANLHLAQAQLAAEDTLTVTVEVTNSGAMAGDEVVQLYVAALGSAVERAPKELKAFARVTLAPGETQIVRLETPVAGLAYYAGANSWIVEPIEYEIIVGRHANDADALRTRMRVQ
jgi:beta-glucosidase